MGHKGVALKELKRFDETIANYDKTLSLKPDYHEASWNKSLTLLLQGDFENDLPLYESRWDSESVSKILGKRIFDKPVWLGVELLQGKNNIDLRRAMAWRFYSVQPIYKTSC
jgi:tetratricopeptide (TPR) repeat protein